jgi:hypothetical protein
MATSDLANQWMVNPTMFDPTQASNQFSNYNNARLPFPPTYNGVPVNAATGQPIQSYLDWQRANPAPAAQPTPGTTLNQTPNAQWSYNTAMLNDMGRRLGTGGPMGSGMGRDIGSGMTASDIINLRARNNAAYGMQQGAGPVLQPSQVGAGQGAGQGAGAGAGQGAGAAPNNWYAALNALANPTGGRGVQTPGATVPLTTGYQPSGGVNQAWLQGIGAGPTGGTFGTPQGGGPVNQNFVQALRNIQNRPQGF